MRRQVRRWVASIVLALAPVAVLAESPANQEPRHAVPAGPPLPAECRGKSLEELLGEATAERVPPDRVVQTERLKGGPGEPSWGSVSVEVIDVPHNVRPGKNDLPRIRALNCLAVLKDERVYADIENLYLHRMESNQVMSAAAKAMAGISPEEALETLRRALRDQRRNYVASAVHGLAKIPGEEATEEIGLMLDHPDPDVSWTAVAALDGRPYAEIRVFLVKLLKDRDCRAVRYVSHLYENEMASDEEFLERLEQLASLRRCTFADTTLDRLRRLASRESDSPVK